MLVSAATISAKPAKLMKFRKRLGFFILTGSDSGPFGSVKGSSSRCSFSIDCYAPTRLLTVITNADKPVPAAFFRKLVRSLALALTCRTNGPVVNGQAVQLTAGSGGV